MIKKNLNFLLIGLACFFLFWNLSGDPSVLKRLGDYSDEGYWLQNPINKINQGVFLVDDQSQSYFGAPIYNFIVTLQFRLFGISFLTARILSIIFLLASSIVLFLILKQKIASNSRVLLYVGSFLILFDNKIFYQWATPVPMEIFFQMLLILYISKYRMIKFKNIIVVLTLVYLAVLTKTTSMWLVVFSILFYLLDNLKYSSNKIDGKQFLKFTIICILFTAPYFLINYIFEILEPTKFHSFQQLIKLNIRVNTNLSSYINLWYILKGIIHVLKFSNSFFIILMPLIGLFTFLLIKFKKETVELSRLHIVLIIFIVIFSLFLLFISQFGYDRRQINLIAPLFLLAILFLEFCISNEEKIKFNHSLIFILLFIIITFLQLKNLFFFIVGKHEINFFLKYNNIYIIISFFLFFVSYFFCSLFFIFKKKYFKLFILSIFINIFFQIIFINNFQTLGNANLKIMKLAKSENIKFVTGLKAHHLAVESKVIPIWRLDKEANYPNWNFDFKLFSPSHATLVVTNCNKNKDNFYFKLKDIPEGYEVKKIDTVFLYRKFLGTGYSDTLLLHTYKYIK